ncbi:class I SAM-dependent methyltransferase [Arthrobacter sp. ISL-72]|uniref:class I SAM-dependent DNA methyltransferase n=1 Tax=Arthrobacter sp. ISL-72 TaxID=2819114 RepID=UPI001BE7A0A1|nr:class I SAM-dependent methyltransferase [Arthrobacter sp. ISL-72]MBT2597134.1 class I SAM-dependent methyltransferase [Arthrobacter sp. ISL-72]
MDANDPLASVRSAYDAVAESYSKLLPDAGFEAPADRGMIEAFAAHVKGCNRGPVADVGCGTGRMTRFLTSLGIDAAGIDASAGMIDVARRSHPGLGFEVAELANLPYADAQLGGVFAWYSIIHSAPHDLAGVFAEFFRVLAPGGYALVSFQAGEGTRHISRAYGHDVSMEAQLFLPATVTDHLATAGFRPVAQMTREPRGFEQIPQAVVLVERPEQLLH